MLKGAAQHGAKRIRIHVLTDGRDVSDGSSVGFVETIENDLTQLREKGVDAKIASGGGRMHVTMDRYEVDKLCEVLFYSTLPESSRCKTKCHISRLFANFILILFTNNGSVCCTSVCKGPAYNNYEALIRILYLAIQTAITSIFFPLETIFFISDIFGAVILCHRIVDTVICTLHTNFCICC